MDLNRKALPYPVLTENNDDYLDSQFQSILGCSLSEGEAGQIVLVDYSFQLSSREILNLIDQGKATFAIDVNCPETLFRQVFNCKERGEIKFSKGVLYGKVSFTSLVLVVSPITGYEAVDLNGEFAGIKFNLLPGDILAVDNEVKKTVEYGNLKFESLVKVVTSKDIDKNQYSFHLGSDVITILMGINFRQMWDILREDKSTSPLLALSVYKDCLYSALDYLIQSEEAESYRWARALNVKLSTMGISLTKDMDFVSLNSIAQQLVSKYSIQRLLQNDY